MSIINHLKVVVLFGALTALLLWVGSFWGAQGLTVAIIFSVILNFASFFWSHKIVLLLYGAKEITSQQNPRLFRIVKEVAQEAGLPLPKVYIIPTQHANAFATGPSYHKSAIACTEGILKLLDDEELKGVIAHEMSHIKNRDTLIQTAAATIAGVISYIAMMARWSAFFGGSRDREGGSGMELLVLAILTPLIATLIQLAISRSREYVADASAANILRKGAGLASALEKISGDIQQRPLPIGAATETTAHLFIANPFNSRGFVSMFMTHPPVGERVKKLREMKF